MFAGGGEVVAGGEDVVGGGEDVAGAVTVIVIWAVTRGIKGV